MAAKTTRRRFRLITPQEGFRKWPAYRGAEIIYDGTVKFCERFLRRHLRLCDQMIHAARSGKQNIAEGSAVSGTSKKAEIELINVARASLLELVLDFEDFLRQRGLEDWDKEHPTKLALRRLAYKSDKTYNAYRKYIEEGPAELAANALICLIHQTRYLLDELLNELEQRFLRHGGFTERLYRMRVQARKNGRLAQKRIPDDNNNCEDRHV